MKILSIAILSIVLSISSCEKDGLKNKTVETLTISSVNTKQDYSMRILLPDNYSESNTYPVVYLLDGYFWFDYVGSKVGNLLESGEISDVILVGIGYEGHPDNADADEPEINALRMIDLTYPTHSENGEVLGGGGLLFYDFIKTELIPEIENKYSIDSANRSIFGHSLGGYFTLFQMMNFRNDGLFKNVVSSSPSLWWSDKHIFDLENDLFNLGTDLPFNLYLSFGEFEGKEGNEDFDNLESLLQNHNYTNLTFRFDRYSTDHGGTGAKAFADVLKFIFP